MSNSTSFPMSAFTYETFASVHLKIMDAYNNKLGTGSGFIGKFGGSYYVVTARHVILGVDEFSNIDALSCRARFVNTNCFIVHRNTNMLENRNIMLDLFSPNHDRNWNEMFDWDVAVLDITNQVIDEGITPMHIDLSEISYQIDENNKPIYAAADDYLPNVTSDVFIVGFPGNVGYITDNRAPIWKRASISSEPHLTLDGRPIFLIDTQGAAGLSGSPVLYRGSNLVSPMGERRKRNTSHNRFHFIGIYCGREGVSPDPTTLSLGRVFKRSAVQNTIMEPRSA